MIFYGMLPVFVCCHVYQIGQEKGGEYPCPWFVTACYGMLHVMETHTHRLIYSVTVAMPRPHLSVARLCVARPLEIVTNIIDGISHFARI